MDFQASYPAPVDDLVDLTSTGQLECHSTSILMASKPDPASAFRALAERDLLNTYRCWLSTHLSFPFPVNSQIDFPPYTRIRLISETTQEKKEHKLKSLLNRIVVKRKRLASKQGFNDNSTLYKE